MVQMASKLRKQKISSGNVTGQLIMLIELKTSTTLPTTERKLRKCLRRNTGLKRNKFLISNFHC